MARPLAAHRVSFGTQLLAAIDGSDRTRADLAAALKVTTGTIGNWIRAETDCPIAWLPEIAAALGVTTEDLVAPWLAASSPPSPPTTPDAFAKRVVEVLEKPLTAPDLMALLEEAKSRT